MSQPRIRPEGDERWIYVAHRHWVALVVRSAIPFTLGLLAGGTLIWRILGRQADFLRQVPPILDTINVVLVAVGIIVAATLVYNYVDWSNDHLIISNKRVIFEDQTWLFSFAYETITLGRIQNVNARVENLLQYVLKYGRVEIQAAGPSAPVVFDRARCPNEIQAELMKEVQREKREQERIRLQAAVQRRLNPDAPAPPIPVVPVEQDLRTASNRWQSLLPTGPIIEGSTIIWHRHWVVLVRGLLWPTLALVVWVAALVLLPRLGFFGATGTVTVLFISLLAIGLAFYWQYADWHDDVYILEPTRLTDLSKLPFGLYEDRREAPLGVIQNVNATSPNLIARIFGYGNVMVETAGARGNFTFDHVPDPGQIQRIVFEYVERFKWNSREHDWNNAITIMEMYEQGRRRGPQHP